MSDPRLIMYHKHPTSARTRFLRLPYGGICGFAALPPQAELDVEPKGVAKVSWHPAAVLHAAEAELGLANGSLEIEPGFRCVVCTGDDTTEILLARFTDIDPPFAMAEALGGNFIDLTQARVLPPIELSLLRHAYELILG
ncbi:hypothetical protein Thimo_0833 [Thioflavicoccus mobilis 8321]|uniref:Uncharacterized protein n=1 Tax=Thioflavicoccus mobilis 8321 TaxID=765912 RepID=L0GWJ2_9GAMM|nr:hypothetical protein [Thioflavicoccus mobilis]AGA89669.1 hypothetical protein Thimo_0833 [Thioflavicoccus mobilis 8321]